MPSSSVTNLANWLARRGALALTGLQATPMVPGTNLSTSNPQKDSGNIIDAHTRTLYPSWPEGFVVKTKDGSTGANVLKLRCRPDTKYWSSVVFSPAAEGQAATLGAHSPINSIGNWSGGNDYAYLNSTIYLNQYLGLIDEDNDPNTPPKPFWDVVIMDCEYSGGYLFSTNTTFINMSETEFTSASSIVDTSLIEPFTSAYVTYSNKVDYIDVFGSPTYPAVTHDFTPRSSEDQAHGLKNYVTSNNASVLFSDGTGEGVFTYILADSDVPYGFPQRSLVKARWHYTPLAGLCGTCPYAGKTVTIEAKFKQATVTRNPVADDPTNVFQTLSMGSWSDHSTETFTLTLPDSLTAQDLGTDFDFPTSPGKVIVLDDLKLVSIS